MTIKNQHNLLILFFCSLLIAVSFLTPTSLSLTTASGNVQTAQNTASIGSGTFTVTLSSTPTSGNTLFLTYTGSGKPSNPTISSVSQSGVTWVKAVSENGLVAVEIWYGLVGINAGKTATITITGGATSEIGSIADICEWANIATTNPLDKTAFNTGLSDKSDTGTTAVTSQSNEFFIGAVGTKGSTDQFSANNGYTLSNGRVKTLGTYISLSELVKISTTQETANSGTNFLSTSWAGCIATFKSDDLSLTPTPTATSTTETPTISPTIGGPHIPVSRTPISPTSSPASTNPTASPTLSSSNSSSPTPTVPEFSLSVLIVAALMGVVATLLYGKIKSDKTNNGLLP